MTADTTFKEFVEENYLIFSLLVFDSPDIGIWSKSSTQTN
jgi:hypothetical protein